MYLRRSREFWIAAALVAAASLYADPAWAQVMTPTPNNFLDQIPRTFLNKSSQWTAVLYAYAWRLFQILATIEFTWSFILLAFKGAELGEWLGNMVNQIMFIGFGVWLLNNWAGDGVSAPAGIGFMIVNSFRQAGNDASVAAGGGKNFSPSDMFDTALNMIKDILDSVGFNVASVGLVLCAIIILLCFAFLAALTIMAIIESYILINASVFFLGFAGSRWTFDLARKTMTYAVSVGAKLFVLQLILGLGMGILMDFKNQLHVAQIQDCLVLTGASVVMIVLAKSVPDLVQSVVNGMTASHHSFGAVVAAAGGGAAAATAAAANAAGAGSAAGAAYKLAQEQTSGGETGSPLLQAGKNMAAAVSEDIGAKLGGKPGADRGFASYRMANRMEEDREELEVRRNKPEAPGPAGGGSSTGGSRQGGPMPSGARELELDI